MNGLSRVGVGVGMGMNMYTDTPKTFISLKPQSQCESVLPLINLTLFLCLCFHFPVFGTRCLPIKTPSAETKHHPRPYNQTASYVPMLSYSRAHLCLFQGLTYLALMV